MMRRDELVMAGLAIPSGIRNLLLAIALVDVVHRPSVMSMFAAESKTPIPTAKAVAPTLVTVTISPEARVKATATEEGPRVLQQGEWTEFTLVIDNAAGITAPLSIESDQLMTSETDRDRDHWLRLELQPPGPLTGDEKEIRTVRLFSRDAGLRTAVLNFNAGQGTQDLGFRSDVLLSFKIAK